MSVLRFLVSSLFCCLRLCRLVLLICVFVSGNRLLSPSLFRVSLFRHPFSPLIALSVLFLVYPLAVLIPLVLFLHFILVNLSTRSTIWFFFR